MPLPCGWLVDGALTKIKTPDGTVLFICATAFVVAFFDLAALPIGT